MSVQRRKTARGSKNEGGRGLYIGHNARLFVFSLIFIKLNIKEQEGRQFVWVREFTKYCSSQFAKRA